MANPRKPTALRLLADNAGKRPLPASEPTFAPCTTTAPDWLAGEAVVLWKKLAPAMDLNGMLNDASRETLAIYCDTMGDYIDRRRAGGEPDIKTLQALRLLAREFGFTPSSQAGISAPGKANGTQEKDRFFG
jgi:phage terminase small subunit